MLPGSGMQGDLRPKESHPLACRICRMHVIVLGPEYELL